MCKGKSFVSICVRAKWKESVDIMGKKARVFYVLFLVWLIWGMLSLSFPEPQPERMLTELYIGTITEYEQTPAGMQFVMDSYNLTTMEGEPLKIKFVITENTIWSRQEIGERLKNCETGLFVRVWTEYLQGSIEDERCGPFPVLSFCEVEVE